MNLNKYLVDNDIPDLELAQKLRFSVYAVKKWRYGERIPRLKTLIEIEDWSGGNVRPRDWLGDGHGKKVDGR